MKIYTKYALLTFSLLTFSLLSSAQTLRGTVRDASTGEALIGANLRLIAAADTLPISTITDLSGQYIFQNLRSGYYTMTIEYGGYRPMIIREINVAGGKETLLDIIYDQNVDLPMLTIVNTATRRLPQPISEIPLTREQTLRFPATFFDPARLAMAYPGVMNNDDQANGLSIRGNSPAFVRWHLEGADIVNPNHLTNAGTFSDRPTAAAGGVLMFSAQLLDNSSLLTGSFPAGYGEALGGIMDMNLRRGNSRQHEFTAQAGLIGLDVAAEGPLFGQRSAVNGQRPSSYLVNYRYSTVGLLGQMGISFGDEEIDFQDLSFKLNFQGKNGGEWSLFGLGGLSNNVFRHKSDSASIEAFKEFFDIDYQSKTGVIGLSNWLPLGKKGWIKTTIAASGQTNERTSVSAQYENYDSRDDIDESKISGSVTLSQRLSAQWRVMAGVLLTRQYFRYESVLYTQPQEIPDHQYLATQPWANATWSSRNEKTSIQGGLHSLIFPYKDRVTLEPRLTITQQIAPNHRLALSGGRYSAIAPLWLLDDDFDLQRAWHAGLRYTWNATPEWIFKGETFLQFQDEVGVDAGPPSTFSLLNENDYTVYSQKTLIYNGSGRNRGLELSAEHYFTGDWFALLNTTFLKSEYQGSDQVWRSARWHTRYITNLTVGKEWQRDKRPGQVRTFGINGRFTWTDGPRTMPVDSVASAAAGYTVFDEQYGYSVAQRDYVRLDLRVYWKRSFDNRRNSTFAMDFQNVTMRENIAYQYWDPYTQKVETKYQLGLIPNLSWRIEF